MSPNRLQELTGRVSSLEMQLEREVQEKEEAVERAERLCVRVAELERQLEDPSRTETNQQVLCFILVPALYLLSCYRH